MKKTLLLPFILTLIIAQQSYTQNPSEHKEEIKDEVSAEGIQWAKDLTKNVDDVCDLNNDQEKQVMAVNLKYANKLEEAKADKELTGEEYKAHKEKIMHTIFSDYDSILTKEQKSKLKERWDQITAK